MYPYYRSPHAIPDQRLWGWPLAIGGLGFLGGLIGGGLGASLALRPPFGYPPAFGYPGYGYPFYY
ncbi:hypothetical protein [Bacillus rubiinfantis]|uniref:hypothetical protein n=1 Tax=Bacillus rubiinfantis TaxID=1499680 RepID=UPI0005A66CC9|nr:hypothetical protein [Bacillus rubiinfantis]